MTNVEALRALGCSECHAAKGAGALAIVDSQSAAERLFTDMLMPGMSGRPMRIGVRRHARRRRELALRLPMEGAEIA